MGLKIVDFRPRHLSFDLEMLNDVQASLGGIAQRYAEGRKGMGLKIVGFQFRRK